MSLWHPSLLSVTLFTSVIPRKAFSKRQDLAQVKLTAEGDCWYISFLARRTKVQLALANQGTNDVCDSGSHCNFNKVSD